ncbi:MAG: hypothetical protein F6J94_25610 [Moorea sp. SIO1F2]|uniref:hypothetical protein n=1 Tax=unclassified Moorena TaxID=2683338 RepID=UPI0013BA6F92|nr:MULTISPECIES: hypothetical protein [unclassified Moorena]NEN99454.1 hypothetical protein [Moorena sp. SIO3I7]NEO66230.1 hypothetical protein [Moorena sp. SIO4G2]NEO08371.1 hypothetical protein [Moorena sp. SIO3I8]NEO21344.1 hypothetical protein [Moorena sp. SIO4A5]NEP24616.1 hypothetical protein [Moorena sp. SIO3I6]
MARYNRSIKITISLDRLLPLLIEVLKSCHFEILYESDDYIMARESPDNISFTKLVTVDVLIDKSKATEQQVPINFVVKNEELPLQVNNHCRQMFELLQEAVNNNPDWQIVEELAS